MLIDTIKPVKLNIGQCLIAAVVPAAIYFKKDYELLFIDSWFFDYNTNYNLLLSERLKAFGKISTKSFENCTGINMIKHQNDTYNDLLDIIKQQLSLKSPVIININSYYCPWTSLYKKTNMNHYCLVIGYDEDKREFTCIDPFMSDRYETLSEEDLEKGYSKCYTFINTNQENEIDVNELIKLSIRGFEKKDGMTSFDKIRLFSDEMNIGNDMIKEMRTSNDLYSFSLFIRLRQLCYGRLNYSWFLKALYNKCNNEEILSCSNEMKECADVWRILWMKATKMAYISNESMIVSTLDKISKKLKQLAVQEEQIYNKLNTLSEHTIS